MKTLKLAVGILFILFLPVMPLGIYLCTGSKVLPFVPIIIFVLFIANRMAKSSK